MFGFGKSRELEELEIKQIETEGELKKLAAQNSAQNQLLENALTQLSSYNTTLYGFLNQGQPVQLSDNTFSYIQNGFQQNADIYSCVDLILSKLSQCTPVVYEVTRDNLNAVQKYRSLLQSNTDVGRIKAKAIEIKAMKEVYMPQITDLLANPNKYQTTTDWLQQYGGFFLLTGNTYNFYNGLVPSQKKWKEMFVLPSQFMQIISGGPMQTIEGYRVINQRFFGSNMFDFPAEVVSHLKTFNPDFTNYGSQLYGQSPLRAYLLTMQKNRDSRIEANKQVKNGGAMGILSPGTGAPAMTSDQARDLKEQVGKRKSSNSNDLLDRIFASGASLNWQQIGLAAADMMLLDSMLFDRTDICNAFHVPITCLNDMSSATDNNVAAHMKKLIYDAVMPLANKISDRLTRDICPAYANGNKTYVIQLDCTTLPEMQQDMANVATWMNTAWWLTPNQKLTGMGFGASQQPNMDKIILPNNYTLIDDLAMTDQTFTQAGGAGANITL